MKLKHPRNKQQGIALIFILIAVLGAGAAALAIYLKLHDPNPPTNPDWDKAMRDPYLRDWLIVPPPPAAFRATPEPEGWQPVWNSVSE